MPWWVWTFGSVALAAWLWRLSFRVLLADFTRYSSGDIDSEDAVGAFIIATVAFWAIGPGVVLVSLLRITVGSGDWRKLVRRLSGESRAQKAKRRERELREREEHIRQLERELNI